MNPFMRITTLLMSSLILLLVGSNTVYYFVSKGNLEDQTSASLLTQSQQINHFLEGTREGSKFYEDTIGQKIRSDSIAIQARLDPDVEKVTNEQLAALAKELNISAISLLVESGDFFTVAKSSEEKEVSLNTKNWGLWNKAFLELYANRSVTKLNWGQSLPNYWSGPVSVSDADAKESFKYGYYYDGTTNYLINPYVSDKVFKEYDQHIGINAVIQKSIKSNPSILEISGINPATFGQEPVVVKNSAGQAYTLRYYIPIFFGKYDYKNEKKDAQEIQKAIDTKKPTHYKTELAGKTVYKTFIPVFTDKIDELGIITENSHKELEKNLDYYVMGITIDYQLIQDELDKILLNLSLIVVIVTIISILALFVLNYYFRKSKDEVAIQTQSTYIEQMNDFFVAVRGQRHDMLNHVQILSSLVALKKYDSLEKYTKELVEDITVMSDIIVIGNPAVSALIQSKLAIAMQRRIKLHYDFSQLHQFPVGLKSVDMVRIFGNLIDNAFDAVQAMDEEHRTVEVRGSILDKTLHITVSNPVDLMVSDRVFEPGFSTKDRTHSGLGLAITKQLVHKYKGTLSLDRQQPGMVHFKVSISLN